MCYLCLLNGENIHADEQGLFTLSTETFSETVEATSNTNTLFSISAGDSFTGNISSIDEQDWIEIEFQAGETYTFNLIGNNTEEDTLKNPYLKLYDSSGSLVSESNHGDSDGESIITYTSSSNGTFYISAEGNGNSTGTYKLSTISSGTRDYGDFAPNASLDSNNTWSGISGSNSYMQGLLWDVKWGDADPTTTTTALKYYVYDNETTFGGYSAGNLFTEETNAFVSAMNAYSSVANITFTESNNQYDSHILWATLDNNTLGNGILGVAIPPDLTNYSHTGALSIGMTTQNYEAYSTDGSLNNADILNEGSYYYITTLHELGHSLGLAHPHDNGGGSSALFPGVSGAYDLGDNGLNAHPYTFMTYNDLNAGSSNLYVPTSTSATSGFLETLGAFDIAAIQYLYGANTTQSTGDDTYFLDGSTIDGWNCIWDNGGTDTISGVSSSAAVNIDLRGATLTNSAGGGGYVSHFGTTAGYTIAYNSTGTCIIENATGSDYFDRIRGNGAGNKLYGLSGNDRLFGESGNDRLYGNNGNDRLFGGSGNDRLYGHEGNDRLNGGSGVDDMRGGDGHDTYIVDSTSDTVTEYESEGTDSIQSSVTYKASNNVENLTLTGSGDINGTGNDSANVIKGNSGANRLYGRSGNDRLYGNDGNDRLYGSDGNDRLYGNDGNDRLNGGSGHDRLCGGIGKNTLTGGSGNDTFQINTGDGRDIITDYTSGEDRIQLLGGLTESDLNFTFFEGHTRISNNGDLLAIVQNTIDDDITFI